ncbi:unnamed protein product, partial [Menidia menidia]
QERTSSSSSSSSPFPAFLPPFSAMTLEAIRYRSGSLQVLNQLLLPHQTVHEDIRSVHDAYEAIKSMKVRGSRVLCARTHARALPPFPFPLRPHVRPLAVELRAGAGGDDPVAFIRESLCHLTSARPTAVNMGRAARELMDVISWIEDMLERDVNDNRKIGNYGAQHILSGVPRDSVTVLTHCNTGSLATAGYGTALAVVVGADRVVANGDTANKVGTYQLAIAAKHHGIPFYVAAPSTSCDLSLETGRDIVIEVRPPEELTSINGVPIAAPGIEVWNPAFDVTPHQLITGGIITELGVFLPSELQAALTGRLTAL